MDALQQGCSRIGISLVRSIARSSDATVLHFFAFTAFYVFELTFVPLEALSEGMYASLLQLLALKLAQMFKARRCFG